MSNIASVYSIQKYKTLVSLHPDDVEVHFGFGIAYEDEGEHNMAVKEFETAIKLNHHHAKAHFNLGLCYAIVGQLGPAAMEWEKANDIDPKVSDILQDRILLAYYKERTDKAIKQFESFSAQRPSDSFGFYQLGLVYYYFGKLEPALQNLRKAIEIKPDYWEAILRAGIIYMALSQHDTAIRHFQKALTINPKFHEAHYNMGETCLSSNKISHAVSCFQNAVDLMPDNSRYNVGLGRAYLKLGKYNLAIRSFQIAIDLNPKNKRAHFLLAQACELINRFDFALDEYKRCLEMDQTDPEIYYHTGLMELQMARPKEAVAALTKAAELNPFDPYTNYYLAEAYVRGGNLAQSIEYYQKAISLNPKDPHAHFRLATTLDSLGQKFAAISEYNEAISLSSTDSLYYYHLGLCFAELGQHTEAINALRNSIELNPNKAEAHLQLGKLLYEQKEFSQAADSLKQTLSLDNNLVEGHLLLGLTYENIDEKEFAFEEFRKVIDLEENNHTAIHHLGRLYVSLRNKPEQGLELLNKSAGLSPQSFEIHIDLGTVHEMLGNISESVSEFEQALVISPYNINALIKLGTTLLNNNKVSDAVRVLEKGLEKNLENPELLRFLAPAYSSQEKYAVALDHYKRLQRLVPEDEQVYFSMGDLYVKLDQPEKALEMAEEIVALDSSSYKARQLRGIIFVNAGEFEKAAIQFEEALTLAPREPSVILTYSLVANKMGDKGKAKQLLTGLSPFIKPSDWRTREELAERFHVLGEDHLACEEYLRITEIVPQNLKAMLRYAKLLKQIRRIEEAKQVLSRLKERALEQNDSTAVRQAESLLMECELKPQTIIEEKITVPEKKQAVLPEEKIEKEPALEKYDKKVKKDSKDTEKIKEEKFEEITQEDLLQPVQPTVPVSSQDVQTKEEFANKEQVASQAVQAKEESTKAEQPLTITTPAMSMEAFNTTFELGNAFVELGKLERAAQEFEKLLVVDQENKDIHIKLAAIYYQQENYEKAEKHLDALLSGGPREIPALHLKAKILIGQKKWKEAKKLLEVATKREAGKAELWADLAQASVELGSWEDADRAFSKALDIQNNVLSWILGRLKSLSYLDNDEETQKVLKQALIIFPNELSLYETQVSLLEKAGNIEQAVKELKKAARLVKPKYKISERLAVLYEKTGDIESAQKELQKAIKEKELPHEVKLHFEYELNRLSRLR